MKKIVIFLSIGMLLSACSFWNSPSSSSETGKTEQTNGDQTKSGSVSKEGDTVTVNYVGKFTDGSIFDTSVESVAKTTPKYSAGRKYEPLQTTLKEGGGTIPGFWKGIIGMKVGEKKTITLAPEDAYGTEWIDNGESTVDKKIFDDPLIRTIPLSETLDVVPLKVPKATLEQEGQLPKVGDVLTNDKGVKAKVESIDDTNVTLSIDNANNPFSGKKMVVGTSVTFEDGNVGTITAVTKTDVTLKIKNNSNPFAGKKLEVGLEGMYQNTQKVKITKIEGNMITLSIKTKNSHALAGKTLVFELELVGIK